MSTVCLKVAHTPDLKDGRPSESKLPEIRTSSRRAVGSGLPDDGLHSPNETYQGKDCYQGIMIVAHFFDGAATVARRPLRRQAGFRHTPLLPASFFRTG
jgi:hypothetical protein